MDGQSNPNPTNDDLRTGEIMLNELSGGDPVLIHPATAW